MDTKLLSKGPKSQLINTDFSSVFASYVSEEIIPLINVRYES